VKLVVQWELSRELGGEGRSDMKITVLCNDKALKGFESEHGISFYIESSKKKYLFDTGSTDVAVKNAAKLGIDLSEVEMIIISHGHYDHLGGLESVLRESGGKRVLIGEGGFEPKYSGKVESSPKITRAEFEELGASVENVCSSKEIEKDLYVMTAAPFATDERPEEKHNKVDGRKQTRDFFGDELSLALVESGIVTVITGCSHRGIGNIIKQASEYGEVKAVVGGLHLLHKTKEELDGIFNYLEGFKIEKFHIGHCTGDEVIKAIERRFSAKVCELRAGETFESLI